MIEFEGPILKTSPFVPLHKCSKFDVLDIGSTTNEYKRAKNIKESHFEYFDITVNSFFGSSEKKLIIDMSKFMIIVSNNLEAKGRKISMSEITDVVRDDIKDTVSLIGNDSKFKQFEFKLENPEDKDKIIDILQKHLEARKQYI